VFAAFCDNNPKRLSEIKALYPDVPAFSDGEELMKSGLVDAVIIATPHYFHPPLAEKAFFYGLHVLSEKPAGVSCLATRQMMEKAKASGKVYGIMFNQRSNVLFRKAKEIVSSGDLGELKRAVWIITNWYRKQSYYDSGTWRATWSGEGGGVLINQAPHNLDILQWICGMPCAVYAKCDEGKYHHIEVEDDVTLVARYKNGATAVFITSTGDFPGTNRLEITGTKGKLLIENGKLIHTILGMDEREYRFSDDSVQNEIRTEEYLDERKNGHVAILNNFAAHILDGEPLIAPGYDGIHELAISNAAYLSAWTGNEISLPMDDALFEDMLRRKAEEETTRTNAEKREDIQFAYKTRWDTQW
jgi:predicted dehydrogenase